MASADFHVTLPAVLTAATALSVQAQLQRNLAALPAGADAVLDAAAVQTFDSAGLSVLLACRREMLARGATLTVTGYSRSLRDLAHMYGVLPLLDSTLAEAQG